MRSFCMSCATSERYQSIAARIRKNHNTGEPGNVIYNIDYAEWDDTENIVFTLCNIFVYLAGNALFSIDSIISIPSR